jgi:hypothetical protein
MVGHGGLIIAALSEPPPPDIHLSELIRAAIDRVGVFDRIAAPAAAIAEQADWPGFSFTWGPLLRFAFDGPHQVQAPLSAAQSRFLAALVGNERLWDPRNGSIGLLFHSVGLPYDRHQCERLATGQELPGRSC